MVKMTICIIQHITAHSINWDNFPLSAQNKGEKRKRMAQIPPIYGINWDSLPLCVIIPIGILSR